MSSRSSSRPVRRLLSLSVGVTAAAALSVATVPAANAAEPTTPIPHSKPGWLAKAKHLGDAAGGAAVAARVYLAPRGGLEALKKAATAVSTPGNAAYGHFITPQQYRAKYGPTDATVTTVTTYLKTFGLDVTGVEAQHRYISVSGDVAGAEKAFHTAIARYQHAGKAVQAPSRTLALPTRVAGLVSTVTGLDTTPHRVEPAAATPAPPPAGFRNARPCSTYFGQVSAKYQGDFKTPLPKFQGKTLTYAPCGYTGPQYRQAYENNGEISKTKTLTGKGVTVAITDAYASPTIAADANRYATNHGDGAYTAGQLTQVQPASYNREEDCEPSGWFGEETLDVEAVHAMAPDAKIRYYASSSCYDDDFLTTLGKVVDENKAKLVSNSWSDLEANESADNVSAYEQVFLQGGLQGISFLFSSGDSGDELAATGLKQVDYPASDPYVTAVGGTSDAIGPDGTFLGQAGWGTQRYNLSADGKSWTGIGFTSGAGGGSSNLFNKPAYQNGVVTGGSRQVPDVGLDADPNTGMLVGETQTFPDGVYYDEYRIGGTSLASPLFAGMTALTVQQAGHGLGLANPSIYTARSTAFTDVKGNPATPGVVRADFANSVDSSNGVTYSVRTFGQDSSLATTNGYDNVTGVGSPNPRWLTAIK